MFVYELNEPIFKFDAEHPARKFLEAFIACRHDCVGKELEGVDQIWFSETDGRVRSFSEFAYEDLSFDVELDGWLTNSKVITESERRALEMISRSGSLMSECRAAAIEDKNGAVVRMTKQVSEVLQLWHTCILARRK